MTGSARASVAALPTDNPWVLSRWMAAAYVCIVLALVGIVAIIGWGIYHDFELVRTTLLQSEINRLRSHVVRSVGLIQSQLRSVEGSNDILVALGDPKLTEHFRETWSRSIFQNEAREYSAVVDLRGTTDSLGRPLKEGVSTCPTTRSS